MLDAMSPARRRLFVGVLGLVAAVVVVAILGAIVGRKPAVDTVAQNELGPILLVPGYGGSTAPLQALATAFDEAGRVAIVVPLAGDGTGDLREQAKALDAAADGAMRRAGASSVDVVGYSAGGVIARLWVADFGGGDVARRVLTLGSPHHGTDVAGLAADIAPDTCPSACQQLAVDSDLLRQLNAGDETPAGPRWVSIWTTDDKVVVPPDSADLDGALDFSVQTICGNRFVRHGDLPRDSAVIAMTLRELGLAAPTKPDTTVCGPGEPVSQ